MEINSPIINEYSTLLVKKCTYLLEKKLIEFTAGDLRVMIGQNIHLDYLVPMAIGILEDDILVEGDYFEGDLLLNVLHIQNTFWENNLSYKNTLSEIIIQQKYKLSEIDLVEDILSDIENSIIKFLISQNKHF